MNQEVRNFSRFFAAFNQLPYDGDKDDLRHELILQFTDNRTDSLKEMTAREYGELCQRVEQLASKTDLTRKKRSACLHKMQTLGVNTNDWNAINAFCMNPRIAGKVFYKLSQGELDSLLQKLRAIESNGGLRKKPSETVTLVIPINNKNIN